MMQRLKSIGRRFLSGKRRLVPLLVLAGLLVLFASMPLPDPLFQKDTGTVVLDRNGKILRMFLDDREQWQMPPDPNHDIPEKLEQAILLKEDRHFYLHPGVNPIAVARAMYQNVREQHIVSGASTITMQLARMIKPKPRTIGNKVLEMCQAVKIELRLGKREILRTYLDHAPFGGNIIGYRAATLKYFGKQAHQLTWSEAATLAVIPNAPGIIGPAANAGLLKEKRDALLRRLAENKTIDPSTLRASLREPVPGSILPTPMLAPHATRLVRTTAHSGWIHTSLDADLQQHVSELVGRHAEVLP